MQGRKKLPVKVKRVLMMKAKQFFSAQDDREEFVNGCGGIGNQDDVCVDLFDDGLSDWTDCPPQP